VDFERKLPSGKAITHAARMAYMAALIQTGNPIVFFRPAIDMKGWIINSPYQGLLKLKKTNPEVF